MTELAKKVIYYRAVKDITQNELAQRCGVDRGKIIDIEHDRPVSKLTEAKIRIVVDAEGVQ